MKYHSVPVAYSSYAMTIHSSWPGLQVPNYIFLLVWLLSGLRNHAVFPSHGLTFLLCYNKFIQVKLEVYIQREKGTERKFPTYCPICLVNVSITVADSWIMLWGKPTLSWSWNSFNSYCDTVLSTFSKFNKEVNITLKSLCHQGGQGGKWQESHVHNPNYEVLGFTLEYFRCKWMLSIVLWFNGPMSSKAINKLRGKLVLDYKIHFQKHAIFTYLFSCNSIRTEIKESKR